MAEHGIYFKFKQLFECYITCSDSGGLRAAMRGCARVRVTRAARRLGSVAAARVPAGDVHQKAREGRNGALALVRAGRVSRVLVDEAAAARRLTRIQQSARRSRIAAAQTESFRTLTDTVLVFVYDVYEFDIICMILGWQLLHSQIRLSVHYI